MSLRRRKRSPCLPSGPSKVSAGGAGSGLPAFQDPWPLSPPPSPKDPGHTVQVHKIIKKSRSVVSDSLQPHE